MTSCPTLTTEGCPPERTEENHGSLTRLLPTRAEQDRLCVRFLCSAHQTCSLSKIICTALADCQHASDCRSFFPHPIGGTIGPGGSSVSPSTSSKNVPRRCKWLPALVRHPLRKRVSEMAPSNQIRTAFRIPWAYSHDPLCRPSVWSH